MALRKLCLKYERQLLTWRSKLARTSGLKSSKWFGYFTHNRTGEVVARRLSSMLASNSSAEKMGCRR
ncbi:hypothetical protein K438DRAFT_931052 [Mycena galopus ATCC 62051]|nr:hypothetical protein K438DRAFT_931052 [Mycena galopus ATCC 62051]